MNNYRNILNLYVSKDGRQPSIRSPFIQDDKVFATDGHILICFDKSLLDKIDFITHPEAPNALKVIPNKDNISQEFKVEYIKKILKKSQKKVKETYLESIDECPDCHGSGEVDFSYYASTRETFTTEYECPVCDGEGKIKIIRNTKTNESVEGYSELIELNGFYFDAKYISLIAETAVLLGEISIRFVYRPIKLTACKFYIGKCIVLLMPVYKSNDEDIITKLY